MANRTEDCKGKYIYLVLFFILIFFLIFEDEDDNESGNEEESGGNEGVGAGGGSAEETEKKSDKSEKEPKPENDIKPNSSTNKAILENPNIDNPYLRAATLPKRTKLDSVLLVNNSNNNIV